MSSDVLRNAAALMRSTAEVATPGRWVCDEGSGIDDLHFGHVPMPVLRGPNTYGPSLADTRHMAGMDPAVALAVADWLDAEADNWPRIDPEHPAVVVARTYLAEASDV